MHYLLLCPLLWLADPAGAVIAPTDTTLAVRHFRPLQSRTGLEAYPDELAAGDSATLASKRTAATPSVQALRRERVRKGWGSQRWE